MKKIISILFLLICLFVFVSCDKSNNEENTNQNEEIDNQEVLDEFKALLNKQDLSPFYERNFTSFFREDYVAYTNSYDDEEKYIDFYRYYGNGGYGYFYSVTQEEYEEIIKKENVNPFDFIIEGSGNYSLLEYAYINNFSSELVDGSYEDSKNDIYYYQRLDSQFDETDWQVYSSLEIEDKNSDIPNKTAKFNGKVNKEALLEVVSTSWLTDTIQRICDFDGHRITEYLDNLYYEICRNLLIKTDKELSDFIKTNNIVISDGEEYTELSFELNDDEIRQILIDNDIFPGVFKGTLYYDKENGSFERYSYKINYTNNEYNEEDAYISTMTLAFTATGDSHHYSYEGVPYIDPNFVEYSDAFEFVDDFLDNIIQATE